MKVLFVQPLGRLFNPGAFVRNCYVEPIGMEYVAAAAKTTNHEVNLVHPILNDKEFAEALERYHPDIICYSVYTYAFVQSIHWANLAKKIYPNIINLFGGYHPSADYLGVLANECIDYVIVGEGEGGIVKFLNWIENKEGSVPGLVYKDKNNKICCNKSERIEDLDTLPFPHRIDSIIKESKSYQIMYPAPSKQRAVSQIDFSRGCPRQCDFCATSPIWGRNVSWRSPQNVIEQFKFLHAKYGTNLIYFSDANITTDKEKLSMLCRELIREDLPISWWSYCRVDELDAGIMSLMKKAKAVKLTVGIEACVTEDIKRLKKTNLPWDGFLEKISTAHNLGFIVRGTFMMDTPNSDRRYYEQYEDFVSNLPLDDIRISFCTPFPNTKYGNQFLKTDQEYDYTKFTTDEPIYLNGGYDRVSLLTLRKKIINSFFGSSTYVELVSKKIRDHPHLKTGYLEYYEYAVQHDVLTESVYNKLMTSISLGHSNRNNPKVIRDSANTIAT